MSLFDEYFNGWPDNFTLFDEFDRKFNFGLIKKLKDTKASVEFLATITEIHYGVFFSKFCDELRYGAKIFNNSDSTPDWSIIRDGQTIIAEVVRINPPEKSKKRYDFIDSLMDALASIKRDYGLSLGCDYEAGDWAAFDISEFRKAMEKWLDRSPGIGAEIKWGEHIYVEVSQKGENNEHVLAAGGYGGVDYQPVRFYGERARVMEKFNKYSPQIKSSGFPFIICPYLHYDTAIGLDVVSETLYGHGTEFTGDIEFDGKIPGTIYHDLSSGLYYNNDDIKRNLSAILISQFNTFTYFHNYSSYNRMSADNTQTFLPYQYKEGN